MSERQRPRCCCSSRAGQHLRVEPVCFTSTVLGVPGPLELTEVDSKFLPKLEKKPGGPDNWVEAVQKPRGKHPSSLPPYIEGIARHLQAKGMSTSHAIASAINTVKKWAAGGGNVTPATQAKATTAVAQWEKMKAKAASMRAAKGKLKESATAATISFDGEEVAIDEIAETLQSMNSVAVTLARRNPDWPEARVLAEARKIERRWASELRLEEMLPPEASASPAKPKARGGTGGIGAGVKAGAAKAKVRGGDTSGMTAQEKADFEKKHPRGAKGRTGAGAWVKKGDGMKGEPDQRVAHLQARLTQLGYDTGGADGKFGPKTEAALSRFQADHNLKTDAQVGPDTTVALRGATPEDAKRRRDGGSAGGGGTTGGTTKKPQTDLQKAQSEYDKLAKQKWTQPTPEELAAEKKAASKSGSGSGSGSGSKSGSGSGSGSANTDGPDDIQKRYQKDGGSSSDSGSGGGDSLSPGTGMKDKYGDKRVSALQAILTELGLDTGPVDGKFGKQTTAAIKALQKKHGLKVDGIVGPKTSKLLEKLAKAEARDKAAQRPKSAPKDEPKKTDIKESATMKNRDIVADRAREKAKAKLLAEADGKADCPMPHEKMGKKGIKKCPQCKMDLAKEAAEHHKGEKSEKVEEGLLRGSARKAAIDIRRLPDGTFAPKGSGQVLRAGNRVQLDGKRGEVIKAVGGTATVKLRGGDTIQVKQPGSAAAAAPKKATEPRPKPPKVGTAESSPEELKAEMKWVRGEMASLRVNGRVDDTGTHLVLSKRYDQAEKFLKAKEGAAKPESVAAQKVAVREKMKAARERLDKAEAALDKKRTDATEKAADDALESYHKLERELKKLRDPDSGLDNPRGLTREQLSSGKNTSDGVAMRPRPGRLKESATRDIVGQRARDAVERQRLQEAECAMPHEKMGKKGIKVCMKCKAKLGEEKKEEKGKADKDDKKKVEEASLRGMARKVVDLKRLPDGTFAPKGRGQVLKPGDRVRVSERPGRLPGTHGTAWEGQVHEGIPGSGLLTLVANGRHRQVHKTDPEALPVPDGVTVTKVATTDDLADYRSRTLDRLDPGMADPGSSQDVLSSEGSPTKGNPVSDTTSSIPGDFLSMKDVRVGQAVEVHNSLGTYKEAEITEIIPRTLSVGDFKRYAVRYSDGTTDAVSFSQLRKSERTEGRADPGTDFEKSDRTVYDGPTLDSPGGSYKPGDRITYLAFGGTRRTGLVTVTEEDVKNGRPGFSMVTDNGDSVWGYSNQVVRVHTPPIDVSRVRDGRADPGTSSGMPEAVSRLYDELERAVAAGDKLKAEELRDELAKKQA